MTRSRGVSRVLWSIVGVTTMSAGCGRMGFDVHREDGDGGAGDADASDVPDSTDSTDDGGIDAAATTLVIAPTFALDTVCGNPMPSTIKLENPTDHTIRVIGVAPSNGFSLQTGIPIDVAPGQSIDLAIGPPTAVIGTDRPGDTKTGSLVLMLDDGEELTVALTATVAGAMIVATDGQGGTFDGAFTSSTASCPAAHTLAFLNTGNRPATVISPTPTWFLVSGAISMVIPGGASATQAIRIFTSAPCSSSESVFYTISGESCTVSPIPLNLSFDLASTSCSCS